MTALTQRRMAAMTAIGVLLFTIQAVFGAPATGSEDTMCQKVEDADLGVEGLQITIDVHVDVVFSDWVGTQNDYASVTVDVTGLEADEDLVWSSKAGSAEGDTLETNGGVIPEDGTYTIGRAADAIRGISHITLCVVGAPEPSTTSTTAVPTTDTTVPTTDTTAPVTVTTVPTTVTTQDTSTTAVVTVTTAGAGGEVLGTTVTAPPDVTSDTLPFTGSGTGGLAAIGLLALVAGIAALGATRREVGDEGEWSHS